MCKRIAVCVASKGKGDHQWRRCKKCKIEVWVNAAREISIARQELGVYRIREIINIKTAWIGLARVSDASR